MPKKGLFLDTVGYLLVPVLFYLNYNMLISAERWRVPFGTPPVGWGYKDQTIGFKSNYYLFQIVSYTDQIVVLKMSRFESKKFEGFQSLFKFLPVQRWS